MEGPLKLVIAGHVDHGKSTLVGRLFYETGSLAEGKYEAIKAMCERRGMSFEWAFLMDALQAERDQGVTIDTSQIWFRTKKREVVIIDAPGHKEFLKNMVTGASQAEAGLLVIDAVEGMREQSRRHAYLLSLLGVGEVAVAVNKMDAAGYDEARFEEVAGEASAYLEGIGLKPMCVIPVSAREGENIASPSKRMVWHKGKTLIEVLDGFQASVPIEGLPLRLPVQDVYRFDERRIIAGRVESGSVSVGDEILFSPSGKRARVRTIEAWPGGGVEKAEAGESTGLTLEDQIFIERGELASHVTDAPVESDVFCARLFWLGREELRKGKRYRVKLATMEADATVQDVRRVIDTRDLSALPAKSVGRGEAAEVVLRVSRMIAFDEFAGNPHLGRFVLTEGYDIAGGGVISMEGYADQRGARHFENLNVTRMEHRVSAEARVQRNGHKGGVLWLTGLSGAGKSTLALSLEQKFFEKGYQAYVLDGDNIRHGLNANLSFTPEDRSENVRRIGEVAALFERAGLIAIAAFISPYRSGREGARKAAGDFHEIYVKADLSVCEGRDPKGLYKKARSGEIADFTGVSAPYEEPESPELVVDTGIMSAEEGVEKILDYAMRVFSVTKG